ncbi:MAG: hypothetical protein HYY50_05285 [Candidatus Kerfeldbacteria bacterium]|nr:hypothetical protein [Candidatus Kerfeldbacteria bacterium]
MVGTIDEQVSGLLDRLQGGWGYNGISQASDDALFALGRGNLNAIVARLRRDEKEERRAMARARAGRPGWTRTPIVLVPILRCIRRVRDLAKVAADFPVLPALRSRAWCTLADPIRCVDPGTFKYHWKSGWVVAVQETTHSAVLRVSFVSIPELVPPADVTFGSFYGLGRPEIVKPDELHYLATHPEYTELWLRGLPKFLPDFNRKRWLESLEEVA